MYSDIMAGISDTGQNTQSESLVKNCPEQIHIGAVIPTFGENKFFFSFSSSVAAVALLMIESIFLWNDDFSSCIFSSLSA